MRAAPIALVALFGLLYACASVPLSTMARGATSVYVWIDLRMSAAEGYFALVDGASIPLPKRDG